MKTAENYVSEETAMALNKACVFIKPLEFDCDKIEPDLWWYQRDGVLTLEKESDCEDFDFAYQAPTLTECIVWFAERGITIITDHCGLDNEWHTVTCFGKDPKKWVSRRGNTSYIEAMNAAIRDAAKAYAETNN